MGKNKKKVQSSFMYVCPNCGNEAQFIRYSDRPIRCRFCRCEYYRSDRIKEKR